MIDVYFVVKIKLYVLRIKSDLSQKGLLAPACALCYSAHAHQSESFPGEVTASKCDPYSYSTL